MNLLKQSFDIENKRVGGDSGVLIIAEAGVSHFGDMDLAMQLVDLAADAGADVFKTQIFDVDELIAKRANDWKDRLRPRNLTLAQAHEIKKRCEERGIIFLTTAHDDSRIPWLDDLNVSAIKVGSGECCNPDFLQRLAELDKPMIVSTGMHYETDVLASVDACVKGGCEEIALLHCVSSYPTPSDEVNLKAIDRLNKIFPGPVGYSDHTADNLAVLAAVARGAKIIEKHITILRDVPNAQDWKVSAGPENMADLVNDIRKIEKMLGHGIKEPAPCEKDARIWALKSLVATHDLPANHIIKDKDLVAKRPGDGILANQHKFLIGRKLRRAVALDEPVNIEDLIDV
ncbi:MAG TPA: N-acylneuraminate-9-phosphate synthase [Gammaproteobacteria bacterium]|nr:N-acylneuraminate-9-phosphate synthase [Gammaproteobacteria bacterium]